MAPDPPTFELEFFLDTTGIDAAQIRTGFVFETSRLELCDLPARPGRLPSSHDNSAQRAENVPRRLFGRPPKMLPMQA